MGMCVPAVTKFRCPPQGPLSGSGQPRLCGCGMPVHPESRLRDGVWGFPGLGARARQLTRRADVVQGTARHRAGPPVHIRNRLHRGRWAIPGLKRKSNHGVNRGSTEHALKVRLSLFILPNENCGVKVRANDNCS